LQEGALRIADGDAVADDGFAFSQVAQCQLVALRHLVAQHQAAGKCGPGRQPAVIRHDGDVVLLLHADI